MSTETSPLVQVGRRFGYLSGRAALPNGSSASSSSWLCTELRALRFRHRREYGEGAGPSRGVQSAKGITPAAGNCKGSQERTGSRDTRIVQLMGREATRFTGGQEREDFREAVAAQKDLLYRYPALSSASPGEPSALKCTVPIFSYLKTLPEYLLCAWLYSLCFPSNSSCTPHSNPMW